MDIKWLKTFITAAKYENFRKASEELFLTQPAITKHIHRLEEHLHIQLFDRNGKSISLTSAGIHFLPYAKDIIEKYEQGLEQFELWKQGYERKLIIAAAPQIASSILPSILRGFMDCHPSIEVLINVLNSYEIGEELSAGRAHLGLTRIKPIQTNINCQIIHEEPVIFTGPYPADTDHMDDEKAVLQKYKLITHNHPDYWEQLLNEIKRSYPAVRTMKVNQIEVTKRFIEQGLGVSCLPYTMVRDELNQKRLRKIETENINLPTSSTYIITKAVTNEVHLFIDYLKTAMENMYFMH
ncbi:LysR family transcriptional regulator [Bacillus benzoevorans]|uniref:LysR family transcriptional repressor of citA n=1 Tax=Bacillus benzoevorans TaxID=1456 RepID=A0A7X0LWR4_9BACI|nr:LysR family transcriptional regulator [Bacillus benzoevorans]MBB6445782.1 LysR family transcriptional repressor of citA [Bacillus benzoevorans]